MTNKVRVAASPAVLIDRLIGKLEQAQSGVEELEAQKAALQEVVELALQRGLFSHDAELLAMARKAAVETRAADYAKDMGLMPGGRE